MFSLTHLYHISAQTSFQKFIDSGLGPCAKWKVRVITITNVTNGLEYSEVILFLVET